MKLRSLVPNSDIHISVSDLYTRSIEGNPSSQPLPSIVPPPHSPPPSFLLLLFPPSVWQVEPCHARNRKSVSGAKSKKGSCAWASFNFCYMPDTAFSVHVEWIVCVLCLIFIFYPLSRWFLQKSPVFLFANNSLHTITTHVLIIISKIKRSITSSTEINYCIYKY
jgi:hypothetical protein